MLTSSRTTRRGLLALLLTAAVAAASEADGGHAPPRRWAHPRGPASGSARSFARAPSTFGGIAWTYKARKKILAPPVAWDGVAFVVDGDLLVALATETGEALGRTTVKVQDPRPAAWDGSVFLRETSGQLVQYRQQGRRLVRRWSYAAGPGTGQPRILDGEVYLPADGGLLRLRAGSKKPVWTAPGRYRGEPAVFREHVYALRDEGKELFLTMHNRSDGAKVTECALGSADRVGGRVVVTDGLAAVLLPPHESGLWAIIAADGKTLKVHGRMKLRTQPIGGNKMLLALDEKDRWAIIRGEKVFPIIDQKQRPDLVAGAPAAVYLRDIVCFGTWAADLTANRVLWHLNERRDTTAFAKGLQFGAVPADDDLLLVVPFGAKSICAIVPEEIK